MSRPSAKPEHDMDLTRRTVLKAQAAGIAAAAANIALPAAAQPVPGGVETLKIQWAKAPCRFCGTGRGVMVGTSEERRLGKECVCTCRSCWSRLPVKKKTTLIST